MPHRAARAGLSELPARARGARGTRRRGRLASGGACAACSLLLAACGSGTHLDGGGFTGAQRTAAQTALDRLVHTSVPRTVVATSYQIGIAPTMCTVIPVPGAPARFQLVVAWDPNGPDGLTAPHSVLEASIDERSAAADHVRVWSSEGRLPQPPNVKASFVRAALAKPAERCQALRNGALQIASAS